MHIAFSRQAKQKVYVQDHLKGFSSSVRSLLLDDGGYFYICGDARMARQVQTVLCQILGEGISTHAGESIVQNLKSEGRYQVSDFP